LADNLIGKVAPRCCIAAFSQTFVQPEHDRGVLLSVKHAVASRLAKAGIAAPVAASLLWMTDKMSGLTSVRSADFMPHGYCYLWDPRLVWLNVISDGLITLSYYCIPVVLIYFIRKRRDLPFNWIFWMFGGFILACGTTHLMEVWNIWHASYLFAGIVKGVTATISVATAILLIPLVPQAVAVPNLIHLQEKNRRLEEQIAKRQRLDAVMADAPLRRWVNSGIALAVSLIVLLGFLSWRSRRSASAESDLVAHTYTVMHSLQAALQHVTEAETSARGFALSGNAVLLAHYHASKDTPSQDVEALRGLTSDNPSQQQRIGLLAPQIGAALRFAEQMVTNRLLRDAVPTASEVLETEKLIEAVHSTVLAMQAEESALLNQRTRKTTAGRRRTDLITIAGTFAGVIFLVVAGAAIRRETNISARARTQLRTLNAELEQRVEQRTAALQSEIAERKRAEEVLREQAQILDSAQVFVRDMESRVVFWPRGAEKLYGFTSQEALGILSHDLFHTQFPEPLGMVEEKLFETGMWEGELIHTRRDGSIITVSSAWVLHRNSQGQPIRILETNVDITARQQAEQQLAGQAEELSYQALELNRSRQALETQTLMLQSVLDSMQEGLVAADETGKFIIWNPAATKIVGMGAKDVPPGEWNAHYGVYLPDTITPLPNEQNPLARAMHGEVSAAEIFLRNPELDEGVWLEISGGPLKGRDGSARGGVVAFRDITQRKKDEREIRTLNEELGKRVEQLVVSQDALRAQTEMLHSVLNSMGEGIVVSNTHGEFILANPAAEKIVGREAIDTPLKARPERFGLYLPDEVTLFPSDDLPLAHALRGEASEVALVVRNPNLGPRWVHASGRPLRDENGMVWGGLVTFRDITQAETAKREIRQLNEELEARVEQRTEELKASNLELEAFTYSVSHDLRAPLRHIGGFSRILLEDFGPRLEPEALSHLHRIEDGTRRMGLLVDELLNLARVGRHALKLEATQLNLIIEDVISLLQPEVNGRVVEWRIAELPSAMCDPVLVKQVFQNLLANALKFTRPRERAVIEIGHRRESGQILLFVRDNGVGFSMKYQDKLFGVFQRLHRAEDFEGTGIGLATVKRIVHKHGGRVWANSELDKGATFYFTLGVAKRAEVMPAEVVPGGVENNTTLAGA
jgi:PAS domain S-box-containing protein